MQPTDGTETLVIDCSLTMAWYFKDEATPYTNSVRASRRPSARSCHLFGPWK